MTSFHSYTFTLELQSVKEFNIVKNKGIKTHFLKKTEQMEVHETGSEIIFSEKRNHFFFFRLPASESGDARLAAPSVPTKTPLALPAALTRSRATDLPSASTHIHTHRVQALYMSANTTTHRHGYNLETQQNTHSGVLASRLLVRHLSLH